LTNISWWQDEFQVLKTPNPNALTLDTSDKTAEQTARLILEHIKRLRAD